MSTNFIDINTIKPYKYNGIYWNRTDGIFNLYDSKGKKIPRTYEGKSINCYKFSHLIKLKSDNTRIKVNTSPNEYLPIVTISTNTDTGRDLTKDSFTILKFIEDNNDLTDKCVDSDSPEENIVQLNGMIIKLAIESNNINTTVGTNIDKYNKLLKLIKNESIKRKLNGGANKELNLEIYEFTLKNYTNNPNMQLFKRIDPIITTSIEESPENTCGTIEYIGKNKKETEDIRSCDLIQGKINDLGSPGSSLLPSSNKNYNFKLYDITSDDLIKFTNIYGAKATERIKIDTQTNRIETMAFLYEKKKISTLFLEIQLKLLDDWIDSTRTVHTPTESTSSIKIIRPTINEKFIIIGDFHGSFTTFIRHLLRFRKMGIMNDTCIIDNNYHLIFLGDIVDRGKYGYEIMILLYLLKKRNPNNIHLNRGNHEEEITNTNYGLQEEIYKQFNTDSVYTELNKTMLYQHSAILIRDPNDGKYIYLAHGGLPTQELIPNKITLHTEFIIPSTENIIINEGESSNIRWNDFYGDLNSGLNSKRTDPKLRPTIHIIGQDILNFVRDNYNVKLIIRAHQDGEFNTKLILPLST
jgi:hypothetical protein